MFKGTFSLFTHIDLKWFDNNLQFVYLKQNSYENIINDTLVEKIWIPSYDFAFVDSQVKSLIGSVNTKLLEGNNLQKTCDFKDE